MSRLRTTTPLTAAEALRALRAARFEVFRPYGGLVGFRLERVLTRHGDEADVEARVAEILATAHPAVPGSPTAADSLARLLDR
jgi:hypothetical protein